jgi:lactoylglutathione lyase
MIKRIAHLAFGVKDMKRSLYFYTEVMGFEKAFTLFDDKHRPWIEYVRVSEYHFIELFYTDPELPFTTQESSYQHFCLETDNIHAFVIRLELKNYPIDSPITMGSDHNWQCWVKDPDGNRIEIMQYGIGSLQMKDGSQN